MSPGENKQDNWYFLSFYHQQMEKMRLRNYQNGQNWQKWCFCWKIHFSTSRLSTSILSKCHPFQITLEGCQMKMFRPSWWLEISALEDISRNWDIFYYFSVKVWIMTILQKGNRSGNEKLKTQPRLLGKCFELIMVPTRKKIMKLLTQQTKNQKLTSQYKSFKHLTF